MYNNYASRFLNQDNNRSLYRQRNVRTYIYGYIYIYLYRQRNVGLIFMIYIHTYISIYIDKESLDDWLLQLFLFAITRQIALQFIRPSGRSPRPFVNFPDGRFLATVVTVKQLFFLFVFSQYCRNCETSVFFYRSFRLVVRSSFVFTNNKRYCLK